MDCRADISVIIPVYNAEKYIEKCLDSVFCQSLENMEIICVDDSSSNSTKDILSRKQKEDHRLRIIDCDENRGPSHARNMGLGAACGNYVYFLDADDTLSDPGAFKILFETAETENLDCVTFETEAVPDGSSGKENPVADLSKHVAYEGIYDGESYLTRLLTNLDFKPAVWMQFWNLKFLREKNISFDEELFTCEDHLFSIKAFCGARRVRHINRKLHRYLCREGSTSRNFSALTYRSNVLAYHRGIEFCLKENVRPQTLRAVTEYSRLLKNQIIHIGADLYKRGEEISDTGYTDVNTLSVCMIVKDEENSIRNALEQISQFADEIIVVDTGSTDRTMEIASEFTDRIYQHPWQDHFGKMRNISYSYAASDYVMYFDADYEIDEENAAKINCLKKILTDEKSVCISYYSPEQKLPVSLHMISLRDDRKWEGAVHERIPLREPVLYTDITVRHSDQHKQHFDRNVRLFSQITDREFKENYWLVAQCYSDSVMAGASEWAQRFFEMSKNGDYRFPEKLSPAVVAGHVLMHYEKYSDALKWFESYLEESARWIDETTAYLESSQEVRKNNKTPANPDKRHDTSEFTEHIPKDANLMFALRNALSYDEKASGYAIKCSARIGNMVRAKELNDRLGHYHADSYLYALNRLWIEGRG